MTLPIYTIPATIQAGDSYILLIQGTADIVPASTDAPNFYMRGPSTLNISGSTVDGPFWQFVFTSAQTSILVAGTYHYAFSVKQADGSRTTLNRGYMTVKPDLSTATARLTYSEEMLHAIECAISGRITSDIQAMSIAGRSITKIPINDLMALRVRFMKEVYVLRHGPDVKKVPVKFGYLT